MEFTLENAIRVLMARSLDAARLLKRRPATTSPNFQLIYNRVSTQILSEPNSGLTAEERELVAAFITLDEESEPRSQMLRVRLTESERADLERKATRERMDMSEYVREYAIGPSDLSWWRATALRAITVATWQAHMSGQITLADYERIGQEVIQAQLAHDDETLKVLLWRYCPESEHITRYPAP